jgi:PTS system N-acetylglucosamine-specific IIC component
VVGRPFNAMGEWIVDNQTIGAGVYGVVNRLLLPFGLHHIPNSLVWFQFGEFGDRTGDLNRFFAGDPTAGGFMTGFFPIMMFGLPAACLAMVVTARASRRKAVAGMLGSAALTSFLTGITEPIEFMFVFVAPALYAVHAVLTGLSLMLVNALDIRSGFTFSAGFTDWALNFLGSNHEKPFLLIGVGLVYGVIYYFVFYFMITKFNLRTPGREAEGEEGVLPVTTDPAPAPVTAPAADAPAPDEPAAGERDRSAGDNRPD